MLTRFYIRNTITKRLINRYATTVKKERLSPSEFLWKMIETKKIHSPKEWKHVRSEILNTKGPVTAANIDALTVGICTMKKEFDLALSYLDFLKEEDIKLNLATVGKYFRLLYEMNVNTKLSKNEEDRILKLYDNVRKTHPILDALTLDSIIQPLSLTSQWKICVDLLGEIKVSSCPTSTGYSVVIAAAFSNHADELAWKLLEEMIENDKQIQAVVYSSYFTKALNSSNPGKEIEMMFNFMQRNGVKIEPNCVNDFTHALKQNNRVKIWASVVHPRGICKNCNNKLQSFDLTQEEFNDLKNKVIQNVIVGKDVFHKTTSEELERFKDFVTRVEKYDVVVDGLNVAYAAGVQQPPTVTSGLVASVVSHFVSLGKKVLVFGRNHMSRWPKQNWSYIQQNSAVFLTENLSQDDPYLLYSALHCGKDTIIVTRDLMRGHKFLLKNVHLKLLFDRWLLQRQYMLVRVVNNGNPIFKKPLPYNQIAQKNGDYWHIPCVPTSKMPLTITHWLCIKL